MFDKLGALLNESIKNGFIPDSSNKDQNSIYHVQTEPIIPENLIKKLKILKLDQDTTYSIAKKEFHEQLKKTHPDIKENHIKTSYSDAKNFRTNPNFEPSAKMTNFTAQIKDLEHHTELLLEDWNLIEKWNDENKMN